jgi:predicted nuclease of predicted toxin-antitoxin system
VKLLFDNNLSPRLVHLLHDLFPASTHVALVGLDRELDRDVWLYASANDCVIVTKDADFSDLSMQRGSPPKVIWLRIGNCSTAEIAQLLRRNHAAITAFAADPANDVLTLIVR